MNFKIDISKLEAGDILICKSHSLLGWMIGEAFKVDSLLTWDGPSPLRPSGHNGIFGYDEHMEPVIFESLMFRGFTATPISDYVKRVSAGDCEIKFARIPIGLTDQQQMQSRVWCLEHLKTPYDLRSYISFLWRIVLRLPPIWSSQDKAHFWCTEAVKNLYTFLDAGWEKILPEYAAPIHIEQLINEQKLKLIDE